MDFTPVVKKSVVYIVGAIIFNERGEVSVFLFKERILVIKNP